MLQDPPSGSSSTLQADPVLCLSVTGESDVARVVMATNRFCDRHGLTPLLTAHVSTAASELANNLWMHSSQGGTLTLTWMSQHHREGVELRSSDAGPGIADLRLAMTDGYSTAGGLGCGLPGVQRLMDEFDIRSAPGSGTEIVARKWTQPARRQPGTLPCRFAMATLALKPGEACGDAAGHWLPAGVGTTSQQPELVAMIDGLGHGAPAAQAAQAALALIDAQAQLDPEPLLRLLDEDLRETRGAAIGLARLDGQRLRYAGVGNTRAIRWRGHQMLRLSSQYGVVGHGTHPRVQVQDIDFQPGDWLLMFSDGIQEMLKLPACLPEWVRNPGLLCQHLMDHWREGSDDAGVLVLHREVLSGGIS